MKKIKIIEIPSYKRKIRIFERKHRTISELILGISLILVWRGVWDLADLYLFPQNKIISSLASIIIGIFILYFRDLELEELLK